MSKYHGEHSVFDVADYLATQHGITRYWLLNRVCYLCQAWNFPWRGYPLIKEDFYAAHFGVRCPALTKNGDYLAGYDAEKSPGDTSVLTDDEKETIDIIATQFGKMNEFELDYQIEWTPIWLNAHYKKKCPVILKREISSFYKVLYNEKCKGEDDEN